MAVTREIGFKFTGDAKNLDQATDTATRRIDRTTESADGLASSAGSLTGGLGALQSGFELAGVENSAFASTLQSTALATDFASGIGDVLATTLGSVSLKSISAKAALVAQTAATKATTVAQRALNLVMRANPIGLVVTALAALAAGFKYAWDNSATFRRIVRGAMSGAQDAIGWVVDRGRDLVSFFLDAPRQVKSAFSTLGSAISAPFRSGVDAIRDAWNATVGGFGFSMPSWLPGLGGREFRIPYLQHGGLARAGMPHVVGENGAELFVPSVDGRVLSNSDSRDALGGNVNVDVNISQGAIEGIAEVVVRRGNRRLKRRAGAAAGAAA